MKKKLTFSNIRFLILILFTIYQLFSLSNIDFDVVNTSSPISILTMTITIFTGLFWMLLIYLIPLIFVIVYTLRMKLPVPVILFKNEVIYNAIGTNDFNLTKEKRFDVVRC